MSDDTYNGWTNRETWLVNLWFGGHWESHDDVESTREYIEGQVNEELNLPDWLKDFISIDSVNWHELKTALAAGLYH